jgi:hypothetical protein
MHNLLTLNTSTTIGNISAFAFFILVKLSTGLTIPFLLRNSLTSVWVDLWSLGSAASCRIARSLLELMNYPLLVAKYCTNISIFIIQGESKKTDTFVIHLNIKCISFFWLTLYISLFCSLNWTDTNNRTEALNQPVNPFLQKAMFRS